MSINPFEVVKKASDVVSKLFNGEKFATSVLQKRAQKAFNNHPNDQTLRMMSNVLEKMANNGKTFISRAEIKDLYSKFATANNKAASYFKEELSLEEPASPKIMQYSENPDVDLVSDAISNATDASMFNALSQVWDENGKLNKKASFNFYDPKLATKAEQITSLTLSRIGMEPSSINKFAGSDKFIICDATYKTPIGESHLLVPVEFSKSGALIPNVFVSKYGFADLTKESIDTHIKETAGKNLQVNASALLETLTSIKTLSSVDETELQVIMAKAAMDRDRGMVKMASSSKEGETISLTTNPIFVSEIDPEQSDPIPDHPAKEIFASLLKSPKGLAEHMFGKAAVENGRALVLNKFVSLGYKPQVVLASCDDDSLIYAAKIDSKNGPIGFEVLVDVTDKKAYLPEIVATKDKVYEFSSEGVEQAIYNNSSDPVMVAKVSPMYDLKPSETLDRFREAADKKDYVTAEDALNVLAINGPKETYAQALNEYMQSMSGTMLKKASVKSSCCMIVKSANYSGPICGHLNLPLNKVYQDEHGNCRPLYRKNMEENYEGMAFNTSKIFI